VPYAIHLRSGANLPNHRDLITQNPCLPSDGGYPLHTVQADIPAGGSFLKTVFLRQCHFLHRASMCLVFLLTHVEMKIHGELDINHSAVAD